MGMNVVLLGPPGSGKGTQTKLLSRAFGLFAIGMGDFLREEVRLGTEIGLEIQSLIDSGQFPRNELVFHVLQRKLEKFSQKNFIFDGIPRDLEQASFLDFLLKQMGKEVTVVFRFFLSDEEAVQRLLMRVNCKMCGAVQQVVKQVSGDICSECQGTEFVRRMDDNSVTIQERLRIHREREEGLLSYYREKGLLISINSSSEVNLIHGELCSHLGQVLS